MKLTFNIRRAFVVLLLMATVLVGATPRSAASRGSPSGKAPDDAQRLVAILQYIGTDYPAAVASGDAGELAEQRSLSSEAAGEASHLDSPSAFADRIASIDARVREGRDPSGVSADCASVVDDLVAATGILRAPLAPPDLKDGAALFAQNCATCHGPKGHGDGAGAAALKPRPVDFHSDEVMRGLTPFKAFNTIRFGVRGTAMTPFRTLDDRQQWALAFYLFTLRQPSCDHSPGRVSLDDLANRSDSELAQTRGASEVACLRGRLPDLDAPALLAAARARVKEGARLAEQGDALHAADAVLDAYLTDIEPIEPWLRTRDAELVGAIEASFTATRVALRRHDAGARQEIAHLSNLLERAAGPHAKASAASVFGLSALVVIREGFEAAVIIAALLAVVKKRKETTRVRLVHAGWTSALAVGAVLFAAGRNVLAGAMNEKLEGYLALLATAMLLHAAVWLNAKSTTRRTMGALRERTRGALDRGGIALFGIAFLAMFRESFETAVFLEALSIDAPSAVAWGSLLGIAALLTLVVAVSRLGLRLPMTTLFRVSTVVLLATAVVLVGQGIHSLQEVAVLPSMPLRFARVDFLGIYPDCIGIIAQVAVGLAPLFWRAWTNRGTHQPVLHEVEPKTGE